MTYDDKMQIMTLTYDRKCEYVFPRKCICKYGYSKRRLRNINNKKKRNGDSVFDAIQPTCCINMCIGVCVSLLAILRGLYHQMDLRSSRTCVHFSQKYMNVFPCSGELNHFSTIQRESENNKKEESKRWT